MYPNVCTGSCFWRQVCSSLSFEVWKSVLVQTRSVTVALVFDKNRKRKPFKPSWCRENGAEVADKISLYIGTPVHPWLAEAIVWNVCASPTQMAVAVYKDLAEGLPKNGWITEMWLLLRNSEIPVSTPIPVPMNTHHPPFPPSILLPTGKSMFPLCWTFGGWCVRQSAKRSSTLSKTLSAAALPRAGIARSFPTFPSPRRCTASAWACCASPWPSPTGSPSTVRGATAGQGMREQLSLWRTRMWKKAIKSTERIKVVGVSGAWRKKKKQNEYIADRDCNFSVNNTLNENLTSGTLCTVHAQKMVDELPPANI